MDQLGNWFPNGDRQAYVDRHLLPGQVLYLHCEFTTPPKGKYLVLVAASVKPRPLLFIINSAVHPFVQSRPPLLACQVQMNAADYGFLDHDSYIDCSKVITDFDLAEIRRQLLDDVGRIRGELSAGDRARIVRVVRDATTLSPLHKRIVLESLQ